MYDYNIGIKTVSHFGTPQPYPHTLDLAKNSFKGQNDVAYFREILKY